MRGRRGKGDVCRCRVMFPFCDFWGCVLRLSSCSYICPASAGTALTPLPVPIQVSQGCSHASPAPGDAPVHLCLLLRAPWLLQDEEEERRIQRGAGDSGVRSRLVHVPCRPMPRDSVPFPSVCRGCRGDLCCLFSSRLFKDQLSPGHHPLPALSWGVSEGGGAARPS